MHEITLLLESNTATEGRPLEPQLFELVHDELRRLARSAMRMERKHHTLQPTALVNEAYLRMAGGGAEPISWESRAHFYNAAARVMRRILIDHARARQTRRREGGRFAVELSEGMIVDMPRSDEMLALNEALERLQELSPRCAKVVEMRFFAGLSVEETAELLSLSPKTVKRESQFARVWFEQQLRLN